MSIPHDYIDNSALEIPFYTTITSNAQFPCDTERMVYDKEEHRYYLTESGLLHYGIDFEPQSVKRLTRTATEHIYSYIAIMAQTKKDMMSYRIAKSLFGRHKSKREGRLEFERILAKQAEFINDFGDAKKTPKLIVNPDTGRMRDNDIDMSTGYWLHDEVLVWLNSNYLTDPNASYGAWQINWSEY